MEIYIKKLKNDISLSNDNEKKKKIASFVKIRCNFCQGVGHIAKSCPTKTALYRHVRKENNNGDELKNYMYDNDIQSWKKTQVGGILKPGPKPEDVFKSLQQL